jgi:hypothetical protein
MTLFWRNWLIGWCWAVIAFGAVLALGAFAATKAPVEALLGAMNPEATRPFDASMRFAVGLMGAVSLGWGLTLHAAVRQALALDRDARGLWRGILTSVLIWYALDSSISVATGFALNAVSNTVLLIGLLVPLWRSGLVGAGRPATA